MVVNDSPTSTRPFEDQSEPAVRFVSSAFQMPATVDLGGVVSQEQEVEIGKSEYTHLLSRVVTLLVPLQNSLPPAGDAVAGNKGCPGGTRVAVHVAFDVATVPGGGLCVEHCAN